MFGERSKVDGEIRIISSFLTFKFLTSVTRWMKDNGATRETAEERADLWGEMISELLQVLTLRFLGLLAL